MLPAHLLIAKFMHHHFLQINYWKILPLMSALLISAVPTKAQELDLGEVCASSVEAATVCAASYYHGSLVLACSLENNGSVNGELKKDIIQAARRSNEAFKRTAIEAAINFARSQDPSCNF